jgi:class 3 adenylate cyclase
MNIGTRAGIHTGEVTRSEDDVHGFATHIASRVMGQAGNGELLVSRTVRDLVAGSAIHMKDRGAHNLKGVTEAWSLFSVEGADI